MVPSSPVATAVKGECLDGVRGCNGPTGDVHHLEVVSGHQLDAHVLPVRFGELVTVPGDVAHGAGVEHIARARVARDDLCTSNKCRRDDDER